MKVIFCDNGFSPGEVDYCYAEEYAAAKQASVPALLISFEELKSGNLASALKKVPESEALETGIYRGWMLKPEQYEDLYAGLLAKNIRLINDPAEYKFCHYLPENYETIKNYTPKTTFGVLPGRFRMEDFKEQLEAFGDHPLILKDYVKSQKHYWNEACFIPDASDKAHVLAVVQKFIELQAGDLNEGLVFREFVELEELTSHSRSGMPLTKEFRAFIKNGEPVSVFKYWDEGDYENAKPAMEQFMDLLPRIKSNFFTMDIARKKDGEWIVVELGDGQVSGLPDNADRGAFYRALK